MLRESIYQRFDAERERQNLIWGRRTGHWPITSAEKMSVLTEEAGEVAREVNECNDARLKNELIQAGAVIVAWLETLD